MNTSRTKKAKKTPKPLKKAAKLFKKKKNAFAAGKKKTKPAAKKQSVKKQEKKAKPASKQKKQALRVHQQKTIIALPKEHVETKVDVTDGMHRTKMRIVGIGGGGGSVIAEIAQRVPKTDFVAANTDVQALGTLPKNVKTLSFGHELTKGLGCGMDADLGARAANFEKEKIKKILEGQDICVLVATLGGGTGSGAVPVFAEVSRELKNLTIGIFTMPFSFEGEKRRQIAEAALERVKPFVNAYVVIPNEKIFDIIDKKTPFKESLSAVNRKLASTLEGFIETIFLPGLINIDFADVKSVLEGRGRLSYLNSAKVSGQAKAQEAVKEVLANPLNTYAISGADRILFNITGDKDLKMQEVAQISASISAHNAKAKIIFGISFHPKFRDTVRITLFAVGCEGRSDVRGISAPFAPRARSEQDNEQALKSRAKESDSATPIPINKSPRKLPVQKKKKQAPKSRLPEQQNASGPQEEQPEATLRMAFMKDDEKQSSTAQSQQFSGVRRSGLELKKAVDEEIKELEEKEKEWDIPSFLRNRPLS